MSGLEITDLLTRVGLPLVLVALIAYVLLLPEKAQIISGWIWSLIGRVFRGGDRKAVALRVQGHVNAATRSLRKQVPDGIIEGKLKIKWSDAEKAQSILRDGEVVVFMRRSRFHEENVAHALMIYLPKAVLPRARRYLDKTTMEAADLTIAKAILGSSTSAQGILEVFYEQHLDPACEEDAVLHKKVTEMDEIDLHGWLLRVLLPEYQCLGNQLHPADPDQRCIADAEAFARWLHRLAAREMGDDTHPLSFEGLYLRIAVIFVAIPQKLEKHGTDPYRRRAKTLIYSGKYDGVYLMARDHNMWAVREIIQKLAADGRVDSSDCNEFKLRPDFAKRKLSRERAIIACLVPHNVRTINLPGDEELIDVEVERFDPADEHDQPITRTRFFERPPPDARVEHDASTSAIVIALGAYSSIPARTSMRPSGLEPPRTVKSTRPQPRPLAPYRSASVRIVRFVWFPGRMGRIGRSECCHDVARERSARGLT